MTTGGCYCFRGTSQGATRCRNGNEANKRVRRGSKGQKGTSLPYSETQYLVVNPREATSRDQGARGPGNWVSV